MGNKLFAWGANGNGQFGNGLTTPSEAPLLVEADIEWVHLSAGFAYVLGIKQDGTLWAWGHNFYGQLGDGSTSQSTIPIQIGSDTWLHVSAGYSHSLGIKSDGTLWAWGRNHKGQLGDNSINEQHAPIQIGVASDWATCASGINSFSLAIKENGTLWGWGYNIRGQLGNGTVDDSLIPLQSGSDADWQQVVVGGSYALAIKTTGTLWGWGHNLSGSVGDGSTTERHSPVQVGTGDTWVDISAGFYHSLGRKSDGSLWGWGDNGYGQLGDGTTSDKYVPTQIVPGATWLYFAAGYSNCNVAIKDDGTLWWWGWDYVTQYVTMGSFDLSLLSPVQIGTDTAWDALIIGNDYILATSNLESPFWTHLKGQTETIV